MRFNNETNNILINLVLELEVMHGCMNCNAYEKGFGTLLDNIKLYKRL